MEHLTLGITICQVLLRFSFILNKTGISLFYISTSCSPLSELSDPCLPVGDCCGSFQVLHWALPDAYQQVHVQAGLFTRPSHSLQEA